MEGLVPSSDAGEFPWHFGVYDAHCHPTDTVPTFEEIPRMKARALTAMATRVQDQHLVAELAERYPIPSDFPTAENKTCFVVPAFGWHPWFSHQIYDDNTAIEAPTLKSEHYSRVIVPSPETDIDFLDSLPEPIPLSSLLRQFRNNLETYPRALIGEFGLDRAFRIPKSGFLSPDCGNESSSTPGGREGRGLTQYHVQMDHQRKIMTAQLRLAGEYQRPVSVHGVAAHGVLYETLRDCWRGYENKLVSKRARKREAELRNTPGLEQFEASEEAKSSSAKVLPFPPRICLHSYSGPPENLRLYLHPSVPAKMYFSFSRLVNFAHASEKVVAVIQGMPDDRILVESDLHTAGQRMDDLLEDIVRTVCLLKGWSLEKGIKQMASNWMEFIYGDALKSESN